MAHLGMVGTTFKRAAQAELQHYTLATRDSAARRALHDHCGFHESVILATCNRVEVIFVAPSSVSVAAARLRIYQYWHRDTPAPDADVEHRAAKALHAYEDEGAAERLFTVAGALDSMNPGEAQILGQVKEAFFAAAELNLVGPRLRLLFSDAFQAAKRVRQSTRLGAGHVSMVSLARNILEERLYQGAGHLIIVGVGAMATQCGELFAGRPGVRLTFVNRTLANAAPLALRFGGEARALESFLRDPGAFDAMVSATGAPAPLFGTDFFARVTPPQRPHVFVDLAVQRDVELGAALAAGAIVFDIDRLKDLADSHRQARRGELTQARLLVDEALERFHRRFVAREVAPAVRQVRLAYVNAVSESVHDLQTLLGPLSAAQQAALEQWGTQLANRLAHLPTVGLKRLAMAHGADAVQAFLRNTRSKQEQ